GPGHRGVRGALRVRGRAAAAVRRPVPPREVELGRAAAAVQLRPHLRARARVRLNLLPAIDIRGGRAVRLVQGDYARETAYDADPVDAARRWAGQGARMLHVVDLDGAREGRPVNLGHVRRIADAVTRPGELGGGLRDADAVDAALAAGAERVVLGTAAHADPELLSALLAEHGGGGRASRGGRGPR